MSETLLPLGTVVKLKDQTELIIATLSLAMSFTLVSDYSPLQRQKIIKQLEEEYAYCVKIYHAISGLGKILRCVVR